MKVFLLPCAVLLIALSMSASMIGQAATLAHVHIATSSPSESVKWYAEHLDCQADAARSDVARCAGVDLEFVARASIGSTQGTGVNHIAFSYPDVAAKMAALEDVGVRGSGVRLQRFEDGSTHKAHPALGRHGFIFDPWGTRIELVQDPSVDGFHHVHLQSVAPESALAWYADVLGGTPDTLNGMAGLRSGDVWILVEPYAEGTPAPTDQRAIDHLAFETDELDALIGRVGEQGANVQAPEVPEDARAEARRAFLSGPDGVLLALVEPGWEGVAVRYGRAGEEAALADWVAPRTPWGEPDLQGMWTGNAAHGIPLERPEELADVDALTPEQAAARRERGTLGSIWGYEREWRDTTLGYDKLAPSTQVAMIIDPPDGRLPPMTEKGEALAAARAEAYANPKLAAGPEDLSTYVRCITRGLPQMMMPGVYNNGLQIAQSPGYVAVQKEMIHETRIIPTTEKPPLGENIRQWLGSSRGHWEGDTLVVTVTGFNGKSPYLGAGENLTLTERYRRVGPNRLEYQFTVDDPTIWTRPWTGMFHFELDEGQYELVEYACHEGNYGMTNILSGARAKERQAPEPAGED